MQGFEIGNDKLDCRMYLPNERRDHFNMFRQGRGRGQNENEVGQ